MKQPVRKILIIRFSSIGDIVLTSPVVRCLKLQLGVEIHYLTKHQYLPLLEASPYIDKVFTIQNNVSEVLPALKAERYDCLVDLHKNFRSQQVRWGLGVKSFTFDKLNVEKWLLVNFKINLLPKVHIVDRYLAAVAPLGIKNDGNGLDYFIPANLSRPPLPQDPFVAFAIGATFATKRLPAEKIVAVCQGIQQPVILLGGKEEAQIGANVVKEAGQHVLNLCGKLSLHESAFVIHSAWKVIAHDTGMMHIAAAFQKVILSVWGNTVPAFGMYPYYGDGPDKNITFEVEGLPCRPCSKLGHRKCPQGHFKCMNENPILKVDKVGATPDGLFQQ